MNSLLSMAVVSQFAILPRRFLPGAPGPLWLRPCRPLKLGKYLCSALATWTAVVVVWSLPSDCPAQPGSAEARDAAQPAASAKAVHRAGQTFLTWQEVEGVKEYRVFRSTEPIRQWPRATLVGSVDEDSTVHHVVRL